MGRRPIPFAKDAAAALKALEDQGGPESLPAVVRRRDVARLFPALYRFDALRRAGHVPGDQLVPGGVWRVDRELFLQWLYACVGAEDGVAGHSDAQRNAEVALAIGTQFSEE